MWGILTALLSGALMSIQGVFNTNLTKQTSLWLATGWVQITAFSYLCGSMVFYRKRTDWKLMTAEPKYILAGGVIGAFITITVIQSMAGLGPAKAAMLIVISQIVVAYLIELFGIFGMEKASFEWRKVIGMAVAIGGIILFKWES